MTEERTRALVLWKVPYQERHMMLTLLSRDLGFISARASGAQGSIRRFGASLDFFVVFTAFLKKRRMTDRVYVLTRTENPRQFGRLLSSFDRLVAAQWILKAAHRLGPNIPPGSRAFDAVVQSFESVETCIESKAYTEAVLGVASLLQACDVPVSFDRCLVCGRGVTDPSSWFFTEHGGVMCSSCASDLTSAVQVGRSELYALSNSQVDAPQAARLISAMVSASTSSPFLLESPSTNEQNKHGAPE